MAEISTTVEIYLEVRAEDAFRWIVEPGNMVYWMNGVRRADWIRTARSGNTSTPRHLGHALRVQR